MVFLFVISFYIYIFFASSLPISLGDLMVLLGWLGTEPLNSFIFWTKKRKGTLGRSVKGIRLNFIGLDSVFFCSTIENWLVGSEVPFDESIRIVHDSIDIDIIFFGSVRICPVAWNRTTTTKRKKKDWSIGFLSLCLHHFASCALSVEFNGLLWWNHVIGRFCGGLALWILISSSFLSAFLRSFTKPRP